MVQIVYHQLYPYLDFSKKEAYQTEEDFAYCIVRWADERVFWNFEEQTIFFEGFPYWYKVDEAEFAKKLEPLFKGYLSTATAKFKTYLETAILAFKTDFGVEAKFLHLNRSAFDTFCRAGTEDQLEADLGVTISTGEYDSPSTLRSSEADGRFRTLNKEALDVPHKLDLTRGNDLYTCAS
jgi:hypothetical protein